MADPEIITATEASRAFSDVLHRVCYGGESFIIKKGNRMMARIVPVEAPVDAPAEIVKQNPAAKKEAVAETATAPLMDGLTQEEADYYKTVVEQLNKMVPETCE